LWFAIEESEPGSACSITKENWAKIKTMSYDTIIKIIPLLRNLEIKII
jgi:hypothetical protein